MKKWAIFVILAILISFPIVETFAGGAMHTRKELTSVLLEYADSHSIDVEELMSELGSIAIGEQKFIKGGVGVINSQLFVILNTPENTLQHNDRRWIGQHFNQSQAVYVDEKNISTTLKGMDLSNLVIVLFTMDEVRFIDLKRNIGGKYSRDVVAEK